MTYNESVRSGVAGTTRSMADTWFGGTRMTSISLSPSIPAGLCHCGCGRITRVAHADNRTSGDIKGQHRRFCKGHDKAPVPTAAETEQRFWTKVNKSSPDGCWEWQGGRARHGYGKFSLTHRITITAHRYSYELSRGPIPDGLCVCHRCDNPPCCNPDHLFLGTVAENNADRDKKGHVARGERSPHRLHPESYPRGDAHYARRVPGVRSGERNGRHVLTEEQVREIRACWRLGGITGAALAAMYGLAPTSMSRILRGETWRNV